MLKLASWNVNSLKVRLDYVLTWMKNNRIDILALQETKLCDEQFPLDQLTEQGYYVVYSGQKTYNGVAIISRAPLDDVTSVIPGFNDPQRRMIAASSNGIRVINLYVPNGAAIESEKYHYKLNWLSQVRQFIQQQLATYSHVAVVGDFNIAPADEDVHDPLEWQGQILVSMPERQAWKTLLDLGLVDSFRLFPQEDNLFSWWDYRAAAFRRNRGVRIDHILLSKLLTPYCVSSQIDKLPRKWERPSDHAPVFVELDGFNQ